MNKEEEEEYQQSLIEEYGYDIFKPITVKVELHKEGDELQALPAKVEAFREYISDEPETIDKINNILTEARNKIK